MGKSGFHGAFVLNRRVDLHAIDATSARWRGGAVSQTLTARLSQHGRVVAKKGVCEESSGAPDSQVDLYTGVVALEVLIGTPNFDASWFVAYKRETDNGNLLLGQRQTIAGVVPDQDKYAHFRGVLGPIVDSIVDRGTTLGRLVSRDTTNAQVAAECSGMLRLDPTLRPTAASIRDALTTETGVTEL